nr:S41 family peptidase [Heyndrickxia acidicola]
MSALDNDDQKKLEENDLDHETNGYIKIKKFRFIMLIFFLIFASAGITTLVMAFGDDKAANVAGVPQRKEFTKLFNTYDDLKQNYYEKIDTNKLVNGAIDGMVQALGDPYSVYMPPDEASKFNQTISSSFEGIGAEVQEKNGYITIVSPIKGSPADKAGLKPNDKVLAVNGKSVHGMSANDVVLLIRGKKGTSVTLSILSPGSTNPRDVKIQRDTIPVDTVYAKMLKNGVADFQITTFSTNTSKELVAAINNMKKQGMKSMILDLRQNPGGLLDQAIAIANLFVPEGKMIVQVEDRNGKRDQITADGGNKLHIPAAVLIDDGSASASEILSAALSESDDVPLIGEKSFGKGTVQTSTTFDDGSDLKFTTDKWLTPKGEWIHKKGIQPEYKVDLPAYANLPVIDPSEALKLYSISSDVKTAEEMLKALGYNPGHVDGYFDQATENAVIKFQRDQKQKPTGVLEGQTTLLLMSKLQNLIANNDTQLNKAVEVLKNDQR